MTNLKSKIKNVKCNIKIRKKAAERKTSLRYILIILFTLQVVFLTSLTGCGKKGPPVPPKKSKSLLDVRLQIADINFPIFFKK